MTDDQLFKMMPGEKQNIGRVVLQVVSAKGPIVAGIYAWKGQKGTDEELVSARLARSPSHMGGNQ